MKNFTFSFKSLLVACGLMLGSTSAWGGDYEIWSEDYESASVTGWASQNATSALVTENENTYVRLYMTGSARVRTFYKDLSASIADLSGENWTMKIDLALGAYNIAYKGASFNVYSSNTTIVANGELATKTCIFTLRSQGTYSSAGVLDVYCGSNKLGTVTISSLAFYTITLNVDETGATPVITLSMKDSSGNDVTLKDTDSQNQTSLSGSPDGEDNIGTPKGLYVTGQRVTNDDGRSMAYVDNILFTKYVSDDFVEKPSASITGAYNNTRTITMTQPEEQSIYYLSSTTDYPSYTGVEAGTLYNAESKPVISANTYFVIWAQSSGGSRSEKYEFYAEAGTTLTLNTPSLSKPYYNSSTNKFTIKVSDDQSSLIGTPSSTLKYYTVDEDDKTATTSGSEITGFDAGTTVYLVASADGFNSSSTSFTFPSLSAATMSTVWTDDFTSGETLTVIDGVSMGNQTCQPITAIGETELTGNVGIDNYSTDRYASTTSGLNVKSTRYMGARNVNSVGVLKVTVNLSGYESSYISARKNLSFLYAVKSSDGNSYDLYYSVDASSVTWNIFSGLYVKSVSYMAPTESVTVSGAGYATFSSNSPLDLANLPDGLTAFRVSGKSGDIITMEPITTTVAANTGLVLKGDEGNYDIPVAVSGTTYNNGTDPVNYLFPMVEGGTINKADEGTNYVLGLQGGNVVFAPIIDNSATVAAGRAGLWLPGSFSSKALRIVDGGTTEVTAPAIVETEEPEVLYNMAGQIVGKDYKGIVINQKGEKRLQK